MKQKSLLKTLLLLCALVVGMSSAWAEEEVFYTLDGTITGGNNGYADVSAITQNEISWSVTGNTTVAPWRIGGKQLQGTDRTVYSGTSMGSAITKVDLTVGTASKITVNSLKLVVASDANFSSQIDEVSATFAENSTITFIPTSNTEWTTGAYYKFVFNVSVNGGTNRYVEFSSAIFYTEASTLPEVATIGDLTPNEIQNGSTGTFALPITYAAGATGTVTWESNDVSVLTVDNGAYTANSKGQANVTVTVTPADPTAYKVVSKTFSVTVTRAHAFNEVFYESFDNCEGTGGNDGHWSGNAGSGDILDVELDNEWVFATVNAAAGCIKCGSNKNIGSAEVTLALSAGTYTLQFKAGAWDANKESTTLGLSATGATLGQESVDLVKGQFTNYTTTLNVATSGEVTITFAGSGGNNRFFLDEVQLFVEKVAATISSVGYATFHSDYAVDFNDTDVTVYTATDNGATVRLTEVTSGQVPANTPVVLYKEDGATVSVPVIESADAVGDNDLYVVGEGGLTGAENIFVLAMPSGKPVGFYLWDSTATLNEGKVYLQGTSGTRTYLPFNEVTGISDMNRETMTNNRYFDMQGRRVAQPTKGMYIVNGKKVIMR